MKATGIVRRVDDLGRIVIPKEIRRTLRIREGDPLLTTLTPIDRFCMAIHSVVERFYKQQKTEQSILLRFNLYQLKSNPAWNVSLSLLTRKSNRMLMLVGF